VKVLRLPREDFWWSREDTLLLISQYREHEKLFRTVNCKRKSIWELTSTHNLLKNFSARPEQVKTEGK